MRMGRVDNFREMLHEKDAGRAAGDRNVLVSNRQRSAPMAGAQSSRRGGGAPPSRRRVPGVPPSERRRGILSGSRNLPKPPPGKKGLGSILEA